MDADVILHSKMAMAHHNNMYESNKGKRSMLCDANRFDDGVECAAAHLTQKSIRTLEQDEYDA